MLFGGPRVGAGLVYRSSHLQAGDSPAINVVYLLVIKHGLLANPSFRFVPLFSQFQCPFSQRNSKGGPPCLMTPDAKKSHDIPILFPWYSHIPMKNPDDIPIFFLVNHMFCPSIFPAPDRLASWPGCLGHPSQERSGKHVAVRLPCFDARRATFGRLATWETLIWHHMTKWRFTLKVYTFRYKHLLVYLTYG